MNFKHGAKYLHSIVLNDAPGEHFSTNSSVKCNFQRNMKNISLKHKSLFQVRQPYCIQFKRYSWHFLSKIRIPQLLFLSFYMKCEKMLDFLHNSVLTIIPGKSYIKPFMIHDK